MPRFFHRSGGCLDGPRLENTPTLCALSALKMEIRDEEVRLEILPLMIGGMGDLGWIPVCGSWHGVNFSRHYIRGSRAILRL